MHRLLFPTVILLLTAPFVSAQKVTVSDFLSLGIFSQTVKEYYLMSQSTGQYWYDSTRSALQWTYNALFNCSAPKELDDQVEELRKLILTERKPQTMNKYLKLDEAIYDFVSFDSTAKAAYECGTCLGQLRFFLPRYIKEEDPIKKELFGHLAEDPYQTLKKNFNSWRGMISGYYSRTNGNPLEIFFDYLMDTGNLPLGNTQDEVLKKLKTLMEDAAKVLADI